MNEIKRLWILAFPIVVSQLSTFLMGLIDTLLVGPLGPKALSALALGNTLYFVLLIVGMGLLMSLDSWVSQAYGAGDLAACRRGLQAGVWLALLMTPLLFAAMSAFPAVLGWAGYDREMMDLAWEYLGPVRWGILPALLYQAYRSMMSAVDITRPLLVSALVANVVNFVLDWWALHGAFGFEATGIAGVGWSTSFSRVALFVPLFLVVRFRNDFKRFPRATWRPDWKLIGSLSAIGLPIGLQYLCEVACFSGSALLIGLKGAVPLAAHQVALNVCALFFMVPVGLGAAGAVRVGQALGRGDPEGVQRAGWTAIGFGVAFACISGFILTAFPAFIIGLYRVESAIFILALDFLAIGAIFQVSDCIQAVAVGVLRGLADTRGALKVLAITYLVSYLPTALLGSFVLGANPLWVWWGLFAALTAASVVLSLRFRWQVGRILSGDLVAIQRSNGAHAGESQT